MMIEKNRRGTSDVGRADLEGTEIKSTAGGGDDVSACPDPDRRLAAMDQAATAASELLKALASPNRLKMLCQLVGGEKSVGQIAALIGIRESSTSQHLALLRKDRLVASRRVGQTIYYRLDSPVAEQILVLLYQHFCADADLSPPHP